MSSSYGDFNKNLLSDLRAHGGKATSGPFVGRDVLILTTKGAKSGETRVNPLVFSTTDNGELVIVGSKGGAPTHPAWFHNLSAHPEVTVEANGEEFNARARITEGEEHERLYVRHADINPMFHDYRKRTTRKIPVVVLERID
jgi:deazaflavin-dependent oxidoreductase (nitroreductase family)